MLSPSSVQSLVVPPAADTSAETRVAELVDGVEGWLTEAEARALYSLALACTGAGAIVEIGSWKGRSTICLASGSRDGGGGHVYAIDPHTGSPEHHAELGSVNTVDEFRANIAVAGVDHLVTPLVATSLDAGAGFDQPVELLFVDGAHEYDAVRADLELWLPKVVEGGFVAVHDSFIEQGGPRRAIRELLIGSSSDVHFVHSLFHARKRERPSTSERLRARAALARQDVRERAQALRRTG
jgi:predicted O-methyltransferase YrrM